MGRGGKGGQAPGTGASAGGVRAMPQLEEGCPAPPSMGRTPEGQGLGRSLGLEACSEHGPSGWCLSRPLTGVGALLQAGVPPPPPSHSPQALRTGGPSQASSPRPSPTGSLGSGKGLLSLGGSPGSATLGVERGPTPPSAGQLSALSPGQPSGPASGRPVSPGVRPASSGEFSSRPHPLFSQRKRRQSLGQVFKVTS